MVFLLHKMGGKPMCVYMCVCVGVCVCVCARTCIQLKAEILLSTVFFTG